MKKSIIAAPAALAAAHIGLSYLTYYEIFERNALIPGKMNDISKKKSKNTKAKSEDPRNKWMHKQEFTHYSIVNDRGQRLQGFYLPAEEKSDKFVLCSHGYRNRGTGEFRFICEFYHKNGFNIFLIDHQSAGESDGDRISLGYYESRDMLLWIDFMLEKFGKDIKISFHGFSMGSASVILLCGNNDLPQNVKFAVADCSFASIKNLFSTVTRNYHIPAGLVIKTVDRINRIKQGFSFDDVSPVKAAKNIKIPFLFCHGDADGLIPVKDCYEIYANCPVEKDILISPEAGHCDSYRKNSERYEGKILEFAERYL